MPVIADTAYPRLPAQPGPVELEAFTPGAAEVAFARQRTRQPGPRLALLVLFKTFQHLGRVVRLADVPAAVLAHVAVSASLADAIPGLAGYDDTTYRVRLATLVRGYAGVASYDREARGVAARACIEAARTRDDLADIVNAGIEELLRCRRELPAFGALLRLARSARTLVNRGYHRRVAAALTPEARTRLAALLAVPAGATRSRWDQVKADPPRPSPQRMREHLAHLAWLREQAVALEAFAGVPDRKLRQFAAEARSLGAADVGRLMESKRLALMAALLRGQVVVPLLPPHLAPKPARGLNPGFAPTRRGLLGGAAVLAAAPVAAHTRRVGHDGVPHCRMCRVLPSSGRFRRCQRRNRLERRRDKPAVGSLDRGAQSGLGVTATYNPKWVHLRLRRPLYSDGRATTRTKQC